MPRKTETAKPSPNKPKKSAPKSAGGRPSRYDWADLRRQHVRSDDTVTFVYLGTQSKNPSLSATKKRAGTEKWTDLRTEFRNQVGTKVRELVLETVEQLRMRHVNSAHDLQDVAAKGLAALFGRAASFSAFEVARLMQLGLETECRARGMEKFTVKIEDLRSPADLKSLTPEQLLELRGRLKARGTA